MEQEAPREAGKVISMGGDLNGGKKYLDSQYTMFLRERKTKE
jgi:hypothetical protein